nr:MAG TPA: hypothetical protein [Caudoviricetes sp.]
MTNPVDPVRHGGFSIEPLLMPNKKVSCCA